MRPIRTPRCETVDLGPAGTAIAPLPSWRETSQYGTAVCSVWEPTPEERMAIAQGANLMLVVWQDPISPVAVEVRAGRDFERMAPTDAGVLGAIPTNQPEARA